MADRILDEYQPLAFYKKHAKQKNTGFSKFEVDGKYYFCRFTDGNICMLSQAYQSVAGRDNGIVSIRTNEKISKRFKYTDRTSGKFGFSLRAGNHQEIAISPDYNSRKAAEHVVGRLTGKIKSKATTKSAAPKKKVVKPAIAKAKTPAKAGNNEQDYKPLAFYQRQTKGRKNGIESFTGDDGKYYFAHFENNKIALISEGYPTKAARDTGIASVEKNISIEKRYDFRGPLKNGKYEYRLKAGNHKEIARSVWYGSAATAATGAAYLMGTRKRAVKKTLKPKPVPVVTPKPSVPIAAVAAAPLAAAAVAAAAIPKPAPKAEPIAVKPAALETETPAVLTDFEGGGIWKWLKWLLLALLALLAMFFLFKACVGGKGDVVKPVPAIACWDGSEVQKGKLCPKKVTCWNGDEVTSEAACPVEPKPKPVEDRSARDQTTYENKRDLTLVCADGRVVEDLRECLPAPKAEPAPVPAPTPTPRAVPTRRATFSSDVGKVAGIFTAGISPVIVQRLGTHPEFGDSRGLTSTAFYDKLNNRYLTNSFDRKYLDYLARELGYEGWTEVSAADFTETALANGTRGVLGYGDFHGYQYAEFDLKDTSHLEAFQLASRNGRTVYFMKRCGNYFYPT